MTADLVPLGIDAVLFWMVWDPKDACVEVEDYSSAVWWAAQTALRDAVGRINLAEVATRREQLDNEVKEILEEKTRAWGITVVSVEIRDIAVPSELQDALSKEAQAERERNSRLLLAEVEKDISEMFVEAAAVSVAYDEPYLRVGERKGRPCYRPKCLRRGFQQHRWFLEITHGCSVPI